MIYHCNGMVSSHVCVHEITCFEKEQLDNLVVSLLQQWTVLQQRSLSLSKVNGNPHNLLADMERLSLQCTALIKRMVSEQFFGSLVYLNLHTWLLDVLLSAPSNEPDEDAISAHLELLTIPIDRIVPALGSVAKGIVSCLHSVRPKIVSSTDFCTVVVENFSFLQDVLLRVLSHEIATLSNSPIMNRFISLLKNVSSTVSLITFTFAEPLVNVMEQLVRLNSNQSTLESRSRNELLMWCLDITKSMVESLTTKLQKQLVQNVLSVLVDNMVSLRLLSTVILVIDHWIQVTNGSLGSGDLMMHFQKLLLKLITCVDLKVPFENLFAVYNHELPNTAFDRLFHLFTYIIWEPLQQCNWMKQCVKLTLSCVDMDQQICLTISSSFVGSTAERSVTSSILAKDFLPHLFYINHGSDTVVQSVWIDCFIALRLSFSSAQKEAISHALNYFLQNESHTSLRDSGKLVIKTLVNAVRGLEPPVAIDASTYRYVGKAQNAWHTCALILEQMASHCGPSSMQTVVPFCSKE
uniref:Uncharacterized protein n=1 Tax=Trichuris muris TaxID=70415 RepID=A0A5S6Q6C6_TRIMR